MKKIYALLLALVMCLSFSACRSSEPDTTAAAAIPASTSPETTLPETTVPETTVPETTVPETTQPPFAADLQMITDAVRSKLQSEEFAHWKQQYRELSGNILRDEEVAQVFYYEIDQLEGISFSGYLVDLYADVAWNDLDDLGQDMFTVSNHINLLIDSRSGVVYDNTAMNAALTFGDATTEENRAKRMLFQFEEMEKGQLEGFLLGEGETLLELTEAEIDQINTALTEPACAEAAPTFSQEQQQIILEAVQTKLQSEEFAAWQQLAQECQGNRPRSPEIAQAIYVKIVYYTASNFQGAESEGYLVTVGADVGWMDDRYGESVANHFTLFIDSSSLAVYDNISTDAGNKGAYADTKTEEGNALYMLWVYANTLGGHDSGFWDQAEAFIEMSQAELDSINELLNP